MSQTLKASGQLTATGNSPVVWADKWSLSLAGTWAGTAKVQMKDGGAGTWVDIPDASFTDNASTPKAGENGAKREIRLNLTYTSGTLEYTLVSGD